MFARLNYHLRGEHELNGQEFEDEFKCCKIFSKQLFYDKIPSCGKVSRCVKLRDERERRGHNFRSPLIC